MQEELRLALARAEEMGAEAEASRHAANEAETMVMEMHRLADDNALLAERLQKMELDLRCACVRLRALACGGVDRLMR